MRLAWKSFIGCAALGLILLAPKQGFAQGTADPEAALKEINIWYSERIKQARDSKMTVDLPKLLAERKAKFEAALKDADVEKTDPAKCLALAQLYSGAQKPAETLAAAKRFLISNPAPAPKYTAQSMVLGGYATANDADGILSMLADMKPITAQSSALLAGTTARIYAPIVATKKGTPAALDLITNMEGRVQFDELKTDAEK
ncbi:MAG: hypothetical protein ABJA67_13760, partial [Chthonomonadales bacterium]